MTSENFSSDTHHPETPHEPTPQYEADQSAVTDPPAVDVMAPPAEASPTEANAVTSDPDQPSPDESSPVDQPTEQTVDQTVDQTEPVADHPETDSTPAPAQLSQDVTTLRQEITQLQTERAQILSQQVDELQAAILRLTQGDIQRLEWQKQELTNAIAVLEKKKERIEKEMSSTYAGLSQDMAVRVQGFKDYMTGTLQDIVANVEANLNLVPASRQPTAPAEVVIETKPAGDRPTPEVGPPTEQTFGDLKQRVEQLLERYRNLPDYYGPAWKLRRTFEMIHSERVADWFFKQAGRGAIRTMGTRLQNILVTSAAISVLRAIYGERVRVLVLATAPERLGEWRRGFQDCLGLTREHFGPEKGVALFEDPDPLANKGDRFVKEELMPLVVIDESEEFISVDLLRFPLVIAFGRDPESRLSGSGYGRDLREPKDFREYREPRDRDPRESRDAREPRPNRDRFRDDDRSWDW
ncbi:MAG: DUF3086 domain-containing protein [Pseudanabaenaceae cyanobacterium]